MAIGQQGADQLLADETRGARHQHGLRCTGKLQILRLFFRHLFAPSQLPHGIRVAQAGQAHAHAAQGEEDAEPAIRLPHEGRRQVRPLAAVQGQQRDEGARIDRQHRVRDALRGGQEAGLVFHDEIPQGQHDFHAKHDHQHPGPGAMPFPGGQADEQQAVDQRTRRVDGQFKARRGLLRQRFRDFMVVDGVEGAQAALRRHQLQGQQMRIHGVSLCRAGAALSRNTPTWVNVVPNSAWRISMRMLNCCGVSLRWHR